MLQTVPDVRVREKGKTEMASASQRQNPQAKNHKSNKTQTLYER
jgi:hypothetical protein